MGIPTHQIEAGLWRQRIGDRLYPGRPALFLDRDGVIVEEVHFLRRVEDIRIIDGVAAGIARAKARDMAIVVVTNQSGVARGHFGWNAFATVQDEIGRLLEAQGAMIDLVLACGYHPDGIGDLARDHPWRKPGPGMFEEAARLLGISLERSLIIGDRFTDLAAGKAAGLKRGSLVATGYGADEIVKRRELAEQWSREANFAMTPVPNAAAAIASWLEQI